MPRRLRRYRLTTVTSVLDALAPLGDRRERLPRRSSRRSDRHRNAVNSEQLLNLALRGSSRRAVTTVAVGNSTGGSRPRRARSVWSVDRENPAGQRSRRTDGRRARSTLTSAVAGAETHDPWRSPARKTRAPGIGAYPHRLRSEVAQPTSEAARRDFCILTRRSNRVAVTQFLPRRTHAVARSRRGPQRSPERVARGQTSFVVPGPNGTRRCPQAASPQTLDHRPARHAGEWTERSAIGEGAPHGLAELLARLRAPPTRSCDRPCEKLRRRRERELIAPRPARTGADRAPATSAISASGRARGS